MSLTFAVDGFLLTGIDEAGCKWTTTEAPGWHNAPPMRTGRESKAQQPGTGGAGPRR